MMEELCSNPRLDVSGESLNRLKIVMSLRGDCRASGFFKDDHQFVLFYLESEKMTPFPKKLSMEECAEVVMGWLESEAVYPENPNIEGSETRGWRCSVDRWGIVEGFGFESYLVVRPYWLLALK